MNQIEHRPSDATHYLVQFDDGDPDDPHNFSTSLKLWITVIMSLMALAGSIGSSIVGPAEPLVAEYINASLEATVLMVALFVLGIYRP